MSNVPEKKYWWWHGKDLVPMVNQLLIRGLENVRLEFDGENFYVRNTTIAGDLVLRAGEDEGPEDGPFNFVHTCPPECP